MFNGDNTKAGGHFPSQQVRNSLTKFLEKKVKFIWNYQVNSCIFVV